MNRHEHMFPASLKTALFYVARVTSIVAIPIATLVGSPPAKTDKPSAKATSSGDVVHICTQLAKSSARLAAPLATKWNQGTTLHVYLMGGSSKVRAKVEEYAVQWNQYSGVKFEFVDATPAEIRVSFNKGGSYSRVGQDCLDVPEGRSTMNFGWLNDETSEEEFSRVVLHEFGHALGLIHEHQNPAGGIHWDAAKVYDYYWKTEGWNRAQVDTNIFRLYDSDITQFSAVDTHSIMLYAIPAKLTTDGFHVGWNRELSETDKEFIGAIYPPDSMSAPAPHPSASTSRDR